MHAPRILVFRGGAIGDFIATLPALALLRGRWPDAFIEIVGYPHIARLAAAGGLADRVTSLDAAGTAQYFSLRPSFADEQRAYVRSFDLVISYLYDPDETVKRNLLSAGARQVIYGSPIVQAGHAVDHLLKPLETLALYAEGVERPRLRLAADLLAAGRERVREYGGSVVALHPGSGSPRKNWPLDRFRALAGALRARTAHAPVFILGEADAPLAAALERAGSEVPVLPPCDLVELAAALSACAGYAGNDSGVTHIAAAVGLPGVAIFGPSDPAVWGPRGGDMSVMAPPRRGAEGLEAIGAEEVLRRLLAALPAPPRR
ncbi:MAG: glycosyltransferase family 9 protein [Lentisphaerae bacterium]|nr:glycosyltransferase family 9 protein [Lentisphaerota bacterium]